MSWSNIKVNQGDIAFSKYIRLKAKQCAKCGRKGSGEKGIVGLQASHFHSRRKWSTRYDEINVDVLCVNCHSYFTSHKTEYEEWKFKQLGQKKYDLLTLRANTTGSKDVILEKMYWRAKLEEYEKDK